jgi:predicted nucleic acid-binding protein
MRALLDTSLLADAEPRPLPTGALDEGWAMSAVTLGELEAGVLLAPDGPTRSHRLRRLVALARGPRVLTVDREVASAYAELRQAVSRRTSNDLWIAATALAHGLVLITADERQARLPLVESHYVG